MRSYLKLERTRKSLVGLLGATFALALVAMMTQPVMAETNVGAGGSTLLATMFIPQDEAVTEVEEQDETETSSDEGSEAASEEAAAVSELEQVKSEFNYTINTLIMFVCAVLVIFMQAGFAMLEVGLNSAKNTVNILFKNVMDLSVGILLFLFIGFSLMYPGDSAMVPGYLGAVSPWVADDIEVVGEGEEATKISGADYSSSADFLFQVAFAATAATIVSGAVAGRMKFSAYLIYSAILTGLIYPISGYWKWGGGFLHEMGFADFAGSVVVHAVGGFGGLAGAIILGPRIGRFRADGKSVPMPGHNIVFAALGVFILWIGWYGFNPGSQLTYSGFANASATTYIALTTTISAAAGTIAAMTVAWILYGKPDVTMALNGALAGLVGITANCDQVSQTAALIIGGISGVLVVAGIVALEKLKIDDPVGAFPVHGLCGVWGGVATGLFGLTIPEGMGRLGYVGVQCLSTLIICVWAFSTMIAVFAVLKAFGVLRVSAEEEQAGLDVSEHGMSAYGQQLAGEH